MVRVELKGYQEALGVWDSKPVKAAVVSTLKKVAKSALTTASTEIRNAYTVKKADLDPRIKIQPPRADALVAEITISGKGMSLSFFNAKQTVDNKVVTRSKAGLKTKTMKRSAKFQGVSVEIKKGKQTQLKSAFMATMRSGHIGVMRRTGKKRLPIQEKQVISLAAMIQNTNVQPAVLQKVQDAWDNIFPQELNYQLNVKGKK